MASFNPTQPSSPSSFTNLLSIPKNYFPRATSTQNRKVMDPIYHLWNQEGSGNGQRRALGGLLDLLPERNTGTRNMSILDIDGRLWWLDHVQAAPPSLRLMRKWEFIQSKNDPISTNIVQPPIFSLGNVTAFSARVQIIHRSDHPFIISSQIIRQKWNREIPFPIAWDWNKTTIP